MEARAEVGAAEPYAALTLQGPQPALGVEGLADYGALPGGGEGGSGVIANYPIADFYLTNPIARASVTMQRCSAELLHGQDLAEAAE